MTENRRKNMNEQEIMKKLDIEIERISKWLNKDEDSSSYYYFFSMLIANSNMSDLEVIGMLEKIKLDFNNSFDESCE